MLIALFSIVPRKAGDVSEYLFLTNDFTEKTLADINDNLSDQLKYRGREFCLYSYAMNESTGRQ